MPVQKILRAVNLKNYPNLQSSLEKYNSQTCDTRPKCCRPDQFPDLFEFLYDFFVALQTLGKVTSAILCDLLQLITPLKCKQSVEPCLNDFTSLGCVIKSLLGPLFGKVGELAVSFFYFNERMKYRIT